MNQGRSIYKSDYVPYGWVENNFDSTDSEFCSTENVDDCLRYISQEFSALGYPAIYTSRPNAVNCDIVKLLNGTFELIGNSRDHAHMKDDLEDRIGTLNKRFAFRNHLLLTDLNAMRKKNSHLKERIEQTERKCGNALEKERQMKEKNNQLLQQLKSEKEEVKRLSSRMQQQKNSYQHEVRRCESNMNQMKARLNQILADKNPDKKIATISPSSLLQRNSKQRGKWKTGTVAKSCVDEMYSSVISSYENRCHDMLQEISRFHQCLEYIQSQMIAAIKLFEEENSAAVYFDGIPLQVIFNTPNMQKELNDRFNYLLCLIKEKALQNVSEVSKKCSDDMQLLKSKLSQHEECHATGELESEEPVSETSENSTSLDLAAQNQLLKDEKEKLSNERVELSATILQMEKEKEDLELMKLNVMKMALQQGSVQSQWHQNLNTLPSFSVMTTKDGLTSVPSADQLKQCLSAPDQSIESLQPLWKLSTSESKENLKSAWGTILQTPPGDSSPAAIAQDTPKASPSIADLPSWAIKALNVPSPLAIESETVIPRGQSNEELDLSVVSEDQSLALLQAAMQDIELKRTGFGAK